MAENLELSKRFHHITLSRLSSIAFAIHLWESPEIKLLIKTYFSNNQQFIDDVQNWYNITKRVLEILPLHSIQVPQIILDDLQDFVVCIGDKIYRWFQYVNKCLKLNISYAEKICWSLFGDIDEEKIFKMYWEKDESLYKPCDDWNDILIYRVACILAQEEFIYQHRKNMIKETKRFQNEANRQNMEFEIHKNPDYVYGLLSTYLCYYLSKTINEMIFSPTLKLLYLLKLTQQKGSCFLQHKIMYRLCFAAGLCQAAAYYFKNLTNYEKMLICNHYAGLLHNRFHSLGFLDYRKEKYGHIYLDFMTDNAVKMEMQRKPKDEPYRYHLNIICATILLSYPSQKLFMSIYEDISKDFNQHDFFNAVMSISDKICVDYSKKCPIKRSLDKYFFFFNWEKTSKIVKGSLCSNQNFLNLYFYMNDFSTLKLLFNWKNFNPNDIDDIMSELWVIIVKTWINKKAFDVLKKFIQNVFQPDEYYEKFKKMILREFSYAFMNTGDFELFDNFLIAVKLKENENNKCELDLNKIVKNLIFEDKIDVAEKLLRWRFETEDDIMNFKFQFRSDKSFLQNHIYFTWGYEEGMETEGAKDKSLNLLKWLFDEDSDLNQFKKELLEGDSWIEKLYLKKYRVNSNCKKLIEDFINFCDCKSLEEIKQNILENIDYYVATYSSSDLEAIQVLLK